MGTLIFVLVVFKKKKIRNRLILCSYIVGRGPPFAYWRKVGLQAYTKICSGVLCNIVVNIVTLLHIRRLRGDNAVLCVCSRYVHVLLRVRCR